MERNLERTDEILKGDETEKMIDLDKEFHYVLYRASRSKKLYQICKTLSDHTLKFRIARIHIPEIAQRAREGHYGICQAIRSGDAEKVDASIERHISGHKRRHTEFTETDETGIIPESGF